MRKFIVLLAVIFVAPVANAQFKSGVVKTTAKAASHYIDDAHRFVSGEDITKVLDDAKSLKKLLGKGYDGQPLMDLNKSVTDFRGEGAIVVRAGLANKEDAMLFFETFSSADRKMILDSLNKYSIRSEIHGNGIVVKRQAAYYWNPHRVSSAIADMKEKARDIRIQTNRVNLPIRANAYSMSGAGI